MNKLLESSIKNEDGLSAVEMMVAVVIAGILIGAVAAYLTAHIRTFETTIDVIDIQYEGQLGFNALGKTAMESMGIWHVEGPGAPSVKNAINSRVDNPTLLCFENSNGTSTAFYYIAADNKIVFKDDIPNTHVVPTYTPANEATWYDFAFNVSTWSIEPGVGNETYEDTDNIYIYMELQDGGASMNLSNLFEFRNKVN